MVNTKNNAKVDADTKESVDLVDVLNKALANAPEGRTSAPIWYYDANTTGVVHINQGMGRLLAAEGVNLPKYRDGTSYKPNYSYNSAPAVYNALVSLLEGEHKDLQVVKPATNADADTK